MAHERAMAHTESYVAFAAIVTAII